MTMNLVFYKKNHYTQNRLTLTIFVKFNSTFPLFTCFFLFFKKLLILNLLTRILFVESFFQSFIGM